MLTAFFHSQWLVKKTENQEKKSWEFVYARDLSKCNTGKYIFLMPAIFLFLFYPSIDIDTCTCKLGSAFVFLSYNVLQLLIWQNPLEQTILRLGNQFSILF